MNFYNENLRRVYSSIVIKNSPKEIEEYKSQGKTIILVSHDIGAIEKYCDRAMLIQDGRIKMIGDSKEVGEEYLRQNALN